MLLQTGDGFAHSGLADVQLSCGGGDIATLSYRVENVIEVKLVHDRRLSVMMFPASYGQRSEKI